MLANRWQRVYNKREVKDFPIITLSNIKMTTATKITRSTFKSFINKNTGRLFIKNNSSFDGMVDCVMPIQSEFKPATLSTRHANADKYTLGINGVWLVGSSRDYFIHFENDKFIGIEVSNCCGDFIVAIKK